MSWDKKVFLSRCPFVPGQKKFPCPAVPLSRDKSNMSVPLSRGTRNFCPVGNPSFHAVSSNSLETTYNFIIFGKSRWGQIPTVPICSAGPALTMGRSRTSTRPRACCHTVPSTCLSLLVNVLICSLYVSSLWLAYYQFIELCSFSNLLLSK